MEDNAEDVEGRARVQAPIPQVLPQMAERQVCYKEESAPDYFSATFSADREHIYTPYLLKIVYKKERRSKMAKRTDLPTPDEYNKKQEERRKEANLAPVRCPKCGEQMVYVNKGLSWSCPARFAIKCPACGYTDMLGSPDMLRWHPPMFYPGHSPSGGKYSWKHTLHQIAKGATK